MKIKINGSEHGLSWGMGCLRLFCDELKCELDDGLAMVLNAGDYSVLDRTKAVAVLVLSAAKNHAYVNRLDQPDITTWDIELYRDTEYEAFQAITNDFLASTIQGETVSKRFLIEAPTEPGKKAKKKQASVK